MRTVWLNGEFVPETEAKVPIFDRALLVRRRLDHLDLIGVLKTRE
ncbi:MAG TPA: hypothetical protein PKG84_08575 [Novosphingobium sp.]|nr:hypothetical protein [Novosphingobium sp.]